MSYRTGHNFWLAAGDNGNILQPWLSGHAKSLEVLLVISRLCTDFTISRQVPSVEVYIMKEAS